MARYFAVNSLAGAKRSSTAVVEVTTAGKFDSTYVANSIGVGNSGNDYIEIGQPFMDASASISGTFYLRFDVNPLGLANGNPICTLFNGSTNAYRLLYSAGLQIQYWNGASWTTVATGSTLTNSTLYTVVLKIVMNTSIEVFLGGTSTASGAVTGGQTAITKMQFYTPATTNSVTNFSQIMGADYDLRDAHFQTAAFNGNSATNTDGTGAYTDVNETVLDESTAIILSTVGHKKGQTKAAITVPAGYGIAALVLNARGRVSGGTITDGKLGVKSSSSSSASTGRTFNGGYEPRGAIFESDPATSGAWSQTSFNNAETYLEAA